MQIEHVHRGGSGLLDLRGHSETTLACSLARTAAAALSDITGSPLACTVTLLRPQATPCTAASDDCAAGLSRADQGTGKGPTSRALDGCFSIILNDHSADSRWPGYAASLRDAGFRSAAAVPLPLKRGYRAALTLYATAANLFAPAVAAQVLTFSAVAAKSLALALQVRADLALSAELRRALASRATIDTACGVLMGVNACSFEQAFQSLIRESKRRNLAVLDIAQSILLGLSGGVAGGVAGA